MRCDSGSQACRSYSLARVAAALAASSCRTILLHNPKARSIPSPRPSWQSTSTATTSGVPYSPQAPCSRNRENALATSIAYGLMPDSPNGVGRGAAPPPIDRTLVEDEGHDVGAGDCRQFNQTQCAFAISRNAERDHCKTMQPIAKGMTMNDGTCAYDQDLHGGILFYTLLRAW